MCTCEYIYMYIYIYIFICVYIYQRIPPLSPTLFPVYEISIFHTSSISFYLFSPPLSLSLSLSIPLPISLSIFLPLSLWRTFPLARARVCMRACALPLSVHTGVEKSAEIAQRFGIRHAKFECVM